MGTEAVSPLPVGDRHPLVGPLWEVYHESRRCSRYTYPESYITKYTSIRREWLACPDVWLVSLCILVYLVIYDSA